MVFSSPVFLFFFLPLALGLYYIIPRRFKNGWLLIASLFFYGYGEPVFLLLMAGSILWNYICGLIIGNTENLLKKKIVLVISVAVNLSALCVFKYTGLFLSTLKTLPVFSFISVPQIALPIGISFYTFQSMSYVIDTYRGNCAPQKNIITFGTYVALFPQLIAGPIVRYVDVQNQLINRKESLALFSDGVRLFTVGLCKKVLLANSLGTIWDSVKYANGCGTVAYWVGIISFGLQIYFDFSGYSDMARGLGNMFGFNFLKNFDYPYISKSITEFWRRWHISLGTWFKEYVYIPLGGNKKGKTRQVFNIIVVWALTGIWHGAEWNFMLWGLYFGTLLILEKFFMLKVLEKIPAFFSHLMTLLAILFGWLIFECENLSVLFKYLVNMFSFTATRGEYALILTDNALLLVVSVFFCLPLFKRLAVKLSTKKWFSFAEGVSLAVLLVLCTAVMINSTYNPFLYFRF